MDKILKILKEINPDHDYENSNDFIEDDLLDSFDVIELIAGIENAYGISIDGLDILPENFKNIRAITEMIEKSGGSVC